MEIIEIIEYWGWTIKVCTDPSFAGDRGMISYERHGTSEFWRVTLGPDQWAHIAAHQGQEHLFRSSRLAVQQMVAMRFAPYN